jgi:hypothetical protein
LGVKHQCPNVKIRQANSIHAKPNIIGEGSNMEIGNEKVREYIVALKNTGNFSYEDIANLSGIPLQTVRNIYTGKTLTDKAYKTGFTNGLITVGTLLILSLLSFSFTFNLQTALYYLIIIFISILGCIIGINKKR